ncbi:MAG: universal stress protein [Pseudomonadales bacterium]|nr:universal stress protein [Pseudomonadales bacterium]
MYQKVLIALDFHGDNDQIIAKGRKLVEDNKAELFLLHVIEPFAMAYSIDGMGYGDQIVSLESSIRKEAIVKMNKTADELGVNGENRLVRSGKPANEIHDVVKEQNIDLIVMGTHGQSGLQLLLGSTANSVLHGVSCDVMTVRIQD